MAASEKRLAVWLKANCLVLLLAAIGLAPLVWNFFCTLWHRPAYQFFPMALAAAGLLAWRIWRESNQLEVSSHRRLTSVLATATMVIFTAGNILWSPWLGMLTLLLGLATLASMLDGWRGVRTFLPVLLMLASIIPPPLGWDDRLTLWLRSISVQMSSGLLDSLQVIHVLQGNTILLPGKILLVEEACSGINSVILCSVFCLFWTLWQKRPLFWLVILVPFTCLFVMMGNVIRITSGAALNYFWKIDLLSGWPHEIFGLVLLLTYCGLILSFEQLLAFPTQSIHPTEAPPENIVSPQNQTTVTEVAGGVAEIQPVRGFKFAGWVLALLGIGILALRLLSGFGHTLVASPVKRTPRDLQLSLPVSLAGWQRLDTKAGDTSQVETLGVRSTVWRFQRNGNEAAVAVDYPLDGFHNVRSCYLHNGWQVMAEDPVTGDKGEDLHAFKLTLERSLCHAVVFHSVMDERGQWLSPPVKTGALRSRLFGSPVVALPTTYRIQIFFVSYEPQSSAEVAQAQALFFQARQALSQQLVEQFSRTDGK